MAELNVPIYDFRHGVLTPKLKDRVNLDLYKSGTLVGQNFLTQLHGPTTYRPGFEHSRTTRRNNIAHFIPFTFADDEAYILSFTEGYMRIFTDGGVVTEDPLSITGITQADPGEITVVGNDYADGDEIFIEGCVGMTDLNGQFFLVAGTVTPGTSERNWPYSVPGNYTYNASDIEVTAGVAQLKVSGAVTNYPFTIPGNYTYPAGIQVNAGEADLVDLSPTDSTFYANYTSDINGTWGSGVLTGTATGGASVSGGELDLTHNDLRYVTYAAEDNADSLQTGCVRFLVRPNYSGTPSTVQAFVSIFETDSSLNNLVQIQQQSIGGWLRFVICDSVGGVISAYSTVAWNPTSGVQYEIELNWDITAGAIRLFVDGVQQGTTQTSTGTRDEVNILRVGTNYLASVNSDFAIDDLLIFSTVQHTANYTPGAVIPQTKYGIDNPTIVNNTGLVFAIAFNSFVETSTKPAGSGIQYQVSDDDGSTWKWWSGAAWVAITGGQTDTWYYTNESNTAATINTNITALGASGTFKWRAYMHSTTGAVTPVLDNIAIGNISYPITDPTIESDLTFPFTAALEDFTETSTKPANTEIQYIVSIDGGTNFLYWSGAAWVASNGTYAQSNLASVVDTNIAALGASGTFTYKAFLHTTDIAATPELSNIHTQFTVAPSDTFNITDQDGNLIDTSGFDAYIGSGTAARVYEIVSPYETADLPQLKFAQKADIMYIDHPSYLPRKLTRFGDGTWTLTIYTRTNDPFEQKIITDITQANPGVVSSTGHGYVDDDLVLIEDVSGMIEVNHTVFTITKINDDSYSIGVSTSGYTAYDSGGASLLSGDAPAAVGFYGGRVFHGGSVNDPDLLFGSRAPDPTTGATRYEDFTVGADADDGVFYALTSASTSSVDRIRFFMGTRQFLAVGTYAGMLKVNGGSDAFPITGTAIESFPVDNFGVADIMPLNFGTDIIYVQRGGEVVYSFKYTLLSDGFKSEDETLQSDEITHGGIKQLAYQQGNPNQIWCAMEDGRLLSFVYSDVEGVSAWSEHGMGGDGTILTVAAQPQEDNRDRVWVAVERTIDGVTRRYVEYLAKNPTIPEREDFYTGDNAAAQETDDTTFRNLMFYAQKRQVHLDSALALDTTQTATITPAAVTGTGIAFTASESIFSADDLLRRIQIKYNDGNEMGIAEITAYVSETEVTCTILQDFASTDPITSGNWYFTQDTVEGLGHLEGETVSILTDGGTHPNRVVSDGAITLAGQATYVIVGLFYYGRVKTMPLELLLSTGITPGKFKSVNKVNLMFRNSLGVSYGTDPYNMQQIAFRDGVQYTDRPPLLFNGVKERPGFDNYGEQRSMWVVQTLPYPCTLNSMIFDMEVSGEN